MVVAAAGCGGSNAPKVKENPSRSFGASDCKRPDVSTCETEVRAELRKFAPTRTQTTYNHCDVVLWSGTSSLSVKSAVLNNDHDDWSPYPAPAWDKGPAVAYGSTSGFARGCSNTVRFEDGNGSIEIYASDPYHGSNGYGCTPAGNYTCRGPLDDGPYDKSRLDGDDLRVIYLACLKQYPRCWGPFTCAGGAKYCGG